MTKISKPDNHNSRQNQRLAIVIALTELFQKCLKTDKEIPEPYLEDDANEESDLILNFDFDPENKGQVRLSYIGEIRILHSEKLQEIFINHRNEYQEILERTQLDSNDVITEEA